MTIDQLVRLCKGYRDLGSAVQAQLDDLLAGNAESCNPGALALIDKWLRVVDLQASTMRVTDAELAADCQLLRDVIRDTHEGPKPL